MLNRVGNFIMYHNGFTILLWVVLISGGTALAANPDVREAVGASVIQSSDQVTQIDNSLIVNTDIDLFDFEIQVTDVMEDEYTYFVDYTYRTLEVKEGSWQMVHKEGSLTIYKSELGGVDFETYAQRQLAEFIEGQRRLLAETQNIEKMLGQTELVVERSYSGLIGRFLDTKEIVTEQMADKTPVKVVTPDPVDTSTSTVGTSDTAATSTATSTPDSAATSTSTSTPATTDPSGEDPVDDVPDQTDPGDDTEPDADPDPTEEDVVDDGEDAGDIADPGPVTE